MALLQRQIEVETPGRALVDVTGRVARVVAQAGVEAGLCHLFVHHTSASLLVTENADPEVHRDLERFFARLVPDGDRLFRHTAEGRDDMPAHVRAALTLTSCTVPVREGALDLGTWQGVYLWEHRARGHRRRITVAVQGDGSTGGAP